MARLRRELQVGERSAFEWLIGVWLPKIFEAHFGGVSKPAPFVRFACQVIQELKITNNGEPYKRQAVEKAFETQKADVIEKRASRSEIR